ncbi:hypothetical protein PVPAM_110034700 [Plasmodium vivax]|nr:hypothetical protein PVPAM_110034700 [Plasmodium vivax]
MKGDAQKKEEVVKATPPNESGEKISINPKKRNYQDLKENMSKEVAPKAGPPHQKRFGIHSEERPAE